jgi:hypothetical protein
MEPRWMFLDVGFYRQKILVDKVGGLLVLVRLGIQPSTGPSFRRRTEIEQDGPALLFGCSQRLINVIAPIYCHVALQESAGFKMRACAILRA